MAGKVELMGWYSAMVMLVAPEWRAIDSSQGSIVPIVIPRRPGRRAAIAFTIPAGTTKPVAEWGGGHTPQEGI